MIPGLIGYYAGTSGTVTLADGESLLGLWCVATGAGGYLQVNGGDHIPLIAGVPFAFALESFAAEWVGVPVVFSGTASYFVKSKGKFAA